MRIEADDPSKKQPKKEEFNPVKSEKRSFKSEIAKMKSMGFKDGWEYFWSYYKVPVFVIIGVIAIVISITMSVIRNSLHLSCRFMFITTTYQIMLMLIPLKKNLPPMRI